MKYQSIKQNMLGDLWTSSYLQDSIRYLCDVCNGRFAGTDDERRAGDYMLDLLSQYGFENVHPEPFEMSGWVRDEAYLSIQLHGNQRPIQTWAMACSPAGDVEGEIIDIKDGTHDQIEALKAEIKGKIVLTNTQGPHRSIKHAECEKHGAIGMIIYNGKIGSLLPAGSISLGDNAPVMPAIGITKEDGEFLLRKLSSGDTLIARLGTKSFNKTVTARNIVAELPGSDPEAGWIIIGGHYDGHDIAQGAYDNGSGTALALEVGRLIAKYAKSEIKAGIRVVLFSGEELGLYGSFAYTAAHPDEMSQIRTVFNADIVGMQQPLVLMTQAAPKLDQYLDGLPDGMDFKVDNSHYVPHSDHFPFALKGVSTLMAVTSQPTNKDLSWCHTSSDTFDKIDFSAFKQSVASAAQIMLHMLCEPEALPTELLSEDAIKQAIVDAGYEESLRMQGLWRFDD